MRCISKNVFFLMILGGALFFASCFSPQREVKRADGYRVSSPANWKTHDAGRGDRAYRLPSGNLVAMTSSCERHPEANLQVLTRHLLFGTRRQVFNQQAHIQVDGEKALHSSVVARLEGRPIYYEVVVLSKRKCVFDFTLVSRKRISSKDVTQFLEFVSSFRYGKS